MGKIYIASIVSGIVGFLFLLGWFLGVKVSALQLMIVSGIIFTSVVIGLVVFGLNNSGFFRGEKFTTEEIDKIEDKALEWWEKRYGEKLDKTRTDTMQTYYGKTPIVGIVSHRVPYGQRAGMGVTMVCEGKPFKIVDKHYNPDFMLLKDPFLFYCRGYSGRPTVDAVPESDAGFYRYRFSAKEPKTQVNINPALTEYLGDKKKES